jgi:hypothetical protein
VDFDQHNSINDVESLGTEKNRSLFTRTVAVAFAIAFTAALLGGFLVLRWRHEKRLRAEQAAKAQAEKPAPIPLLQIYMDDAMIKGSQATIGGTVQNISKESFAGLVVDLELKRRKDGVAEIHSLKLTPANLSPDEQGRYSITIPSGQYRESRVAKIRSQSHADELAFKTTPGARRPPERTPDSGKTIIVNPSPRRSNGEEFINTPDTPVRVP